MGKRPSSSSAPKKTPNTEKNKAKREAKRKADREKWATDKNYLKKQAEKGYEKINGKWIRKRQVSNA
jgi:hypothetical protein